MISEDNEAVSLALLGRPNVGKSSLLNALVGKQQAIVSEVAGTTRDVSTAEVKYHGQTIRLLDTAGLRRRGKIAGGVEKYSSLRTLSAISRADICAIIIDATEPSVAGDQHIAGMAAEAGKGIILVVNKWDAIEKDDKIADKFLHRLQANFAFVSWAPVIFTSATQGLHVTKLFDLTTEIAERRKTTISTGQLNRIIEKLVSKQAPAGLKNRRPKINYATQVDVDPPAFAMFGTYPEMVHFSYKRYLENGLREAYDFTGTPIGVEFRGKRGNRKE
jgi:GTP-binding protein